MLVTRYPLMTFHLQCFSFCSTIGHSVISGGRAISAGQSCNCKKADQAHWANAVTGRNYILPPELSHPLCFVFPSWNKVVFHLFLLFLDAIASPSSYPCQSVGQWVSQWVIDSFRFGDSYRISELCEIVKYVSISSTYPSQSVMFSDFPSLSAIVG